MNFDSLLIEKVLDPIHGTIRMTDFERKVINHRLFQRLRSIKQNTFLYKVFPSAMHSRFEHSLGVMHIAYKMYKNLVLNAYRYKNKYSNDLFFKHITKIPPENIQELRLAALLHDVGHGPMSHQFDKFLMNKKQLINYIGDDDKYKDIYDLINDEDPVEHEHISLLFIKKIIADIDPNSEEKINIDNILSIIKPKYKNSTILLELENKNENYNIHPLFSSLISSSPIDSDRMDYLLRDSYFSGAKCGIYSIERLLMSVLPVVINKDKYKNVCLAFTESSLDSISEFVFSRMNLFSQLYFHKTNRSFSAMLSKACDLIVDKDKDKDKLINNLYDIDKDKDNLQRLEDFYVKNSDEHFINTSVRKLLDDIPAAENLINCIIEREPWHKLYAAKIYNPGAINDVINKEVIDSISVKLKNTLNLTFKADEYIIDIMTNNAFKDIDKSEIQLLLKDYKGDHDVKPISECQNKLNIYQSLRYIIRVFYKDNFKKDEFTEVQKALEKIIEQARKKL
ncbi:MAG: HD domain-containing protein [Psychromonas sp.]|nr:HD domain-containing protein [Psychromonas sp.]